MKKYQYEPAQFAMMEQSCIPLAVYQYIDRRVVSIVISDGFCRLFGYSREEVYDVMDHDMYRDAHPDDISRISDAAVRFARNEDLFDVVYRTRKGIGWEIIHAIGEHIFKEDGTRLAVVTYTDEGPYQPDSSEKTSRLNLAMQETLHRDSIYQNHYYDQLTGLPSMTHFFELAELQINRMKEEGISPALLFLDLSGMKFFNRKYGFEQGDALLREVGRLLVNEFSSETCSRFGQDHFVALGDCANLEEKIERIFDQCRMLNSGNSLPVRIGIYCESEGLDPVDIATACDRAKYACDINRKTAASEYRYFDETMLRAARMRQYIINNIDRAISENWIHVYYQPIIRAVNGKVCDEEALARWIDPEVGLLNPADFIPVLEETRLIYKLDLFVLDQVLNKMKGQADAGLFVVPQSINLSRADFDSLDIVEVIRKRVDEEGIPREKLTLEVTESMVGKDFAFMKEQIERLRSLGFQVWMDDFGSGYSSLDVLQNIHFDLIKFDMRFMQKFFDGPQSRIILTELVRMAIGLNTECLAEGVEHAEQVTFLRDIGCMKLQGFYYCKPVPPEEIVRRNQLGIQIGYENPLESEYYESIGRINLFDVSSIAGPDFSGLGHYFDTLPMAVIEVGKDYFRIIRCNKTYRETVLRHSPGAKIGEKFCFSDIPAAGFYHSVKQCAETGNRIQLDEADQDSTMVHALLQRVSLNPVTGSAAVAVGVLSITDPASTRPAITFSHIARALSADYTCVYYVNLTNDQFVEFASDAQGNSLTIRRHGSDFFRLSLLDAKPLLDPEDYADFARVFTRENILRSLAEHSFFLHNCRMMIQGEPHWMSLKICRMMEDASHIIIGVSDFGKIRQKEASETGRKSR